MRGKRLKKHKKNMGHCGTAGKGEVGQIDTLSGRPASGWGVPGAGIRPQDGGRADASYAEALLPV